MEVYVFEKEKTRAFRMERRKYYEQNKKVVEEILKIGKERQVKAGYRGDVHLPDSLHNSLWQDAGKGYELTCIMQLYGLQHGPELLYAFTGEFGTPSHVLAQDSDIPNLEGLVSEVKKTLQGNILYDVTLKPWFYTFEQQETLYTADEEQKAMKNMEENFNSSEGRDFLTSLAETEEERQAVAAFLNGETSHDEVQAHDLTSRGLTPEEREEFIRIYNS